LGVEEVVEKSRSLADIDMLVGNEADWLGAGGILLHSHVGIRRPVSDVEGAWGRKRLKSKIFMIS
jgi:hypothetical protein